MGNWYIYNPKTKIDLTAITSISTIATNVTTTIIFTTTKNVTSTSTDIKTTNVTTTAIIIP